LVIRCGQNLVRLDCAGPAFDRTGLDAAGIDAVGIDAVGIDAVGIDAVGIDAVGINLGATVGRGRRDAPAASLGRVIPMTGPSSSAGSGFHDGELAVQQRAGVDIAAARLAGMLRPADLRGGASQFLAERTFAAITARDSAGRLWISALTGAAGFLQARGASLLVISAVPVAGDPLHRLDADQPVGLLAVDFATRRRFRMNGTLMSVGAAGLEIWVDQAYGNCPQYIQRRSLGPVGPIADAAPRRGSALTPVDAALIERADTFLLGTTHPQRGNDASHRGGSPGFVRVERDAGTLWWPDYPGNNMFNSLGNLVSDETAALLFADFVTGHTLHLSGTATLGWTAPGSPGDDGGTGRRIQFRPERIVAGSLLGARAEGVGYSPANPPLTPS
jgi:predicted pyridoxine 5'-phosphate oxidase superfamily flavin-nucleotide-binding protein